MRKGCQEQVQMKRQRKLNISEFASQPLLKLRVIGESVQEMMRKQVLYYYPILTHAITHALYYYAILTHAIAHALYYYPILTHGNYIALFLRKFVNMR